MFIFCLYLETKVEFKCVVLEGQSVKRWEKFPNEANRKYKARYLKTILKGTENDDGGKEFIQEKGLDEETDKHEEKKKPEIEPSSKKNDVKCSHESDLSLNGT
jgi:hypothetical protein